MCLRLSFSVSYLFFLYRSPFSQDCGVLDSISNNIDKAISLHLFAQIFVLGDFNAHHTMWFNNSVSDLAGIQTLNFSITQSPTQVYDFPTRFPSNPNGNASLLDLFYLHPWLLSRYACS